MSEGKNTITINTQWLIVGALVVLVVIAGLQALSLFNLKSSLSEGKASVSVKSASPAPTTGGATGSGEKLKQNLNNLPSMVGGC